MNLPQLPMSDRDRARANECEAAFDRMARSKGYTVTKRGWPDFLCEKNGEYVAVEVKPRRRGRIGYLKYEQVLVMMFLQRLGVRCYVSDGEECQPFTLRQHASCKTLQLLGLYPLPPELR